MASVISAVKDFEMMKDDLTTGNTGLHRGIESPLPVLAVNHSFDPVPQAEDVEVHWQPHPDSAQPHVGEKLRFMDWMDSLDCLNFDDYPIFDDQIDAIADFKFVPFVDHWKRDFRRHIEPSVSKLMGKAT